MTRRRLHLSPRAFVRVRDQVHFGTKTLVIRQARRIPDPRHYWRSRILADLTILPRIPGT